MLSIGSDPNRIVASSKRSALHVACGWCKLGTARILLENGADPEIFDRDGETPLHVVGRKGLSYKGVIQLLLEFGARPDTLTRGSAKDSGDGRERTAVEIATEAGFDWMELVTT